jgi:hypothetical protein
MVTSPVGKAVLSDDHDRRTEPVGADRVKWIFTQEQVVLRVHHQGRTEMSEQNAVVAVYATHTEAEGDTGDRMKYWGKTGAFWGGFWGLLFGSAFVAIPGLGPVLVAGPLVAWIVGVLEGAAVVGGLGAIGAGLYGMGIPINVTLHSPEAVGAAAR